MSVNANLDFNNLAKFVKDVKIASETFILEAEAVNGPLPIQKPNQQIMPKPPPKPAADAEAAIEAESAADSEAAVKAEPAADA